MRSSFTRSVVRRTTCRCGRPWNPLSARGTTASRPPTRATADGFGIGGEEPDRPEETDRPEAEIQPSADAGGQHADPPPFRTSDPTEASRERD